MRRERSLKELRGVRTERRAIGVLPRIDLPKTSRSASTRRGERRYDRELSGPEGGLLWR